MAWVIKDTTRSEYYRQSNGKEGWYSKDIVNARVYGTKEQAQRTIQSGNHHVTFPYNRSLYAVEIEMKEV